MGPFASPRPVGSAGRGANQAPHSRSIAPFAPRQPRQILDSHRGRPVGPGAIAELALTVEAPAPNLARVQARAGMEGTRADLDRVLEP